MGIFIRSSGSLKARSGCVNSLSVCYSNLSYLSFNLESIIAAPERDPADPNQRKMKQILRAVPQGPAMAKTTSPTATPCQTLMTQHLHHNQQRTLNLAVSWVGNLRLLVQWRENHRQAIVNFSNSCLAISSVPMGGSLKNQNNSRDDCFFCFAFISYDSRLIVNGYPFFLFESFHIIRDYHIISLYPTITFLVFFFTQVRDNLFFWVFSNELNKMTTLTEQMQMFYVRSLRV